MEFPFLFMELMTMKIKTGYLYHIKDEYFDVVNDENLMQTMKKGGRGQLILQLKTKKYYGLFQLVLK